MAEGDVELEAFRRLYPGQFLERYLYSSVRSDGRPLTKSREKHVDLNAVSTADGSAIVKIGYTTMLAGAKLEVMEPAAESPDQGALCVEFIMPPICSSKVRPGRTAEEAYVITEQIQNAMRSSGLLDLRELSIVVGKAAWIIYLDIYCLDADGSLLDAALLASVAALATLVIPAICMKDEGKITRVTTEVPEGLEVTQSRKLKVGPFPFALTVAMNSKSLVADPTAEEEAILNTTMTIVMDSNDRLISLYKAGGSATASISTIQDCIALAKRQRKSLQKALDALLSKGL